MKLATIALGLLCAAAALAQVPEPRFEIVTEDLKLEPLADGVWRHVSYQELESFGRTPGNGLVVVSNRTAALIDTPWTDDLTRELFRWVEERLDARIEVVVASHHHDDCLGGLDAAHRLGARSYASKKTARLARRAGRPVPQTTFRRRLEVEVGSRRLELFAAGPGHTRDNIVVFVPGDGDGDRDAAGVLFGGCLVRSARSRTLGYTGEADLERWPRTIETVLERYGDAGWIVPGHGAPGGEELLRRTLELLAPRKGKP